MTLRSWLNTRAKSFEHSPEIIDFLFQVTDPTIDNSLLNFRTWIACKIAPIVGSERIITIRRQLCFMFRESQFGISYCAPSCRR